MERFAAELSAENVEVLERLALHAPGYFRYALDCKTQVATHCDFRADNMLFGERDGELAMVTIDWIGMLIGGGRDLAHFLGTSLLSDVRRANELDLVTRYHEALLAQGVSDFSFSECFDDYRISLFYPVQVVVNATASVNIDARGNELFMSMFNRACTAIRETKALELIEAL